MSEVLAPSFVMHGARAAMAGGLTHIEEQVKSIELAVIENPGLAFDLSKTIVESACRTILVERKITFAPDDNLPRLYRAVTSSLPMLPIAASGEGEARKSLVQTLNGLHTALQGVCELRNAYGFASHGADSPRPPMESVQALLAAQAADAIVGFLHRLHRGEASAALGLSKDRSSAVDMVLDALHEPVTIAGQPYVTSEALFAVDREAYRSVAASVFESRDVRGGLAERYPDCLEPNVAHVSFVQYESLVYLKVVDKDGRSRLEDTAFIAGIRPDQFFSPEHEPDENARLLLDEFDAYSIVNCFDLFTEDAGRRIFEAHKTVTDATGTGSA